MMGCALDEEVDTGEVEEALTSGTKCPDPENCTYSNNGGVYTDELGYAGFGPATGDFMITHFINTGTSVTLQGRYFDSNLGYWVVGNGRVMRARYSGQYYPVVAVSESMTTPTFTLRNSAGQTFTVTGQNQIPNNLVLELYLDSLGSPGAVAEFPQIQIYWDEWVEPVRGVNSFIRSMHMKWRFIGSSGWIGYCRDHNGDRDPMVFQQGIALHAASGDLLVGNNDNYVTLSCRKGAVATSRLWGYSYRTTQQSLDAFAATIHMKRAAYCGDKRYYTVAGTELYIWDRNVNVPSDDNGNFDPYADISSVEALWNKDGAICVNKPQLRHPEVTFPPAPDPSGEEFVGVCDFVTQPTRIVDEPCSMSHLPLALVASRKK